MHFNIYDVPYYQFSCQHVSAPIAAFLRMILLQECKVQCG